MIGGLTISRLVFPLIVATCILLSKELVVHHRDLVISLGAIQHMFIPQRPIKASLDPTVFFLK